MGLWLNQSDIYTWEHVQSVNSPGYHKYEIFLSLYNAVMSVKQESKGATPKSTDSRMSK